MSVNLLKKKKIQLMDSNGNNIDTNDSIEIDKNDIL